jgi:hypothetical protein
MQTLRPSGARRQTGPDHRGMEALPSIPHVHDATSRSRDHRGPRGRPRPSSVTGSRAGRPRYDALATPSAISRQGTRPSRPTRQTWAIPCAQPARQGRPSNCRFNEGIGQLVYDRRLLDGIGGTPYSGADRPMCAVTANAGVLEHAEYATLWPADIASPYHRGARSPINTPSGSPSTPAA